MMKIGTVDLLLIGAGLIAYSLYKKVDRPHGKKEKEGKNH